MSLIPRSSPQWYAEQVERLARVDPGGGDRFVGYAVGVRFSSGDVLSLQRWPASTVGPAYTSVWHQAPDGCWALFANAPVGQSCARYFTSIAAAWREEVIRLHWSDAHRLRVDVRGAGIEWEVDFRQSMMTRAFGAARGALPDALVTTQPVLRAVEWMSCKWLGAEMTPLSGVMPDGTPYRLLPRQLWLMDDARAWIGGGALGGVDRSSTIAQLESHRVGTSGVLTFLNAEFGAIVK